MIDIKKLKALAEASSPGPWFALHPNAGQRGSEVAGQDRLNQICGDVGPTNAHFIAAANPAAVLELIAQTEEDAMHMRAFGEVMRSQAEQIDQLKAENEALHAEAAKWKNESVSDSQTIYSLSCNLAQRTGEVREIAGVVDDLAALTKKFVQRLSKAAPDNDLPAKALDYLGRKGLQGGAMREIVEGRLS